MKYAVISATAAGDTIVIAGVAGKKIRVLDYILTSNNNIDIQWKSTGGTALSGVMYVGAHGWISAVGGYQTPAGMFGLFEVPADEGLVIDLGASHPVGGHLTYQFIGV
jgi:hypothetical protein